jgi:transcriptional regulator of acetoin/glycerol metabolism/DNA-binding CsgD family transcriptional regulator
MAQNMRKAQGDDPTVQGLLQRARETLGDPRNPREVILGSWSRSAAAGLRPDRFEVPYDADVDDRGRLAWASASVLDRVGADLEGTSIGLVLTDDRGLVVSRRIGERKAQGLFDRIQLAPGFLYGETGIGTNAIGTAIASRAPTVVQAEEHFAQVLTGMACAATTVTDPATGRLLGVVDLSCAAADASPLMLPLAKRAAWEIEQRLLEGSALGERPLQEQFVQVGQTTKAALAAVSDNTLLVNEAAAGLIDAGDRERLWDCALQVLHRGQDSCECALTSGVWVTVRCRAVLDGSRVVGALVRLEPTTPVGLTRPRSRSGAYGWDSITEAELAVARQVSQGLTNREAAARLFVSPSTIDFHLRQLFRKLEVRSRVELTRVVLQQEAGVPSP